MKKTRMKDEAGKAMPMEFKILRSQFATLDLDNWRSQIVTSNKRGDRILRPPAGTEKHGCLRSQIATSKAGQGAQA
jgi:hypothetical protein